MAMESLAAKISNSLTTAEKEIQSAQHLIRVVLPVVKDNKLLIRALERVEVGLKAAISSVLKIEYLYKRIELSADAKKNFEIFCKRCAPRYDLSSEDVTNMRKIFGLIHMHKQSTVEFSKGSKIVLLDERQNQSELTKEDLLQSIAIGLNLLKNARKTLTSSS